MSIAKLLPELPLSVSHHGDSIIIIDATGSWIVGQCAGGRGETAAFIMRACNSHDELLAACKALLKVVSAMGIESDSPLWSEEYDAAHIGAREAIAKAEGKA